MTEDKEIMPFEEVIKYRPRCLYQKTCLHLKQKTRECKNCIHYKDYWREVVEKEQKEKILSLKQENYELKESLKVFNRPDIKKVLTLYNVGEIQRLEQDSKQLTQWLDEARKNADI